jgi:hypothetical protein
MRAWQKRKGEAPAELCITLALLRCVGHARSTHTLAGLFGVLLQGSSAG